MQIDWAYSTDYIEAARRTNVILAANTSTQAGLKLYSYLLALGENVLYCNTNSVAFDSVQEELGPPLKVNFIKKGNTCGQFFANFDMHFHTPSQKHRNMFQTFV